MTGDGSFFPDPPGNQYSSRNAKSVLNYHPVLEFNGNKNDFWLLFDDSDILAKCQSRPLRKPQKPADGAAKSKVAVVSKPGFSNTFTEAASSKSGFLRPKDDDELSQKSDTTVSKDRFEDSPDSRQARFERLTRSGYDTLPRRKKEDRRRSRSRERRRPSSRERGRSRSLERRRSRTPDRRWSPAWDKYGGDRRDSYSGRTRSRSRDGRKRHRSRSGERLRRSKEMQRMSPSSSRMGCRSKKSISPSSNSSNGDGKGVANKDGKAVLLKKFAEKLQEKASTSSAAKKSLSSIRLNSRLEDTKHRRAEAITPIVFSLKKTPIKAFPATTMPQNTEEKKKFSVEPTKKKPAEPMEISEPSEMVSSTINVDVPSEVPPPLIPSPVFQIPPALIPVPPPVSQQAKPIRVTDGVTVACPPTLYKDGKNVPVSSAVIALPPSLKPPPPVVSQPTLVVSHTPPVTTQPTPITNLPPPQVSQPMEAPIISEIQQNLAAQAFEYAAMAQVQDSMMPGQVLQMGQQNLGMPPPGYGSMIPPEHGIRPGMKGHGPGQMIGGPGLGLMGPRHFGPQGQFMGPHAMEGHFMGGPHGPEGPFMGPPLHGPEGPFMGPPSHGPDGPFRGPPPHGPDGQFMGPPPHGPDGPFIGPPPHGSEGPFRGPPPHGPDGQFLGPPVQGPDGTFMGPPPHTPDGQFVRPPPHGREGLFMGQPQRGPDGRFMGPLGPGMRPPFLGTPSRPIRPQPVSNSVSFSSVNTTAISKFGKTVTANPKVEAKTAYSSQKPVTSVKEEAEPSSSPTGKVKTVLTAEKSTTILSTQNRKQTPPTSTIASLAIPNFEKIEFIVRLIKFFQSRSDLKTQITALEKSSSDEFCIKNGLLCKVKKESDKQVLVIMVPEDGNARKAIVTAFVLKYPDLDVEALIELFEKTFYNMPMEDIEDVFEDESTRSSTLLKSTDVDFSEVKLISSCGKVVLLGEKSEVSEKNVETGETELPGSFEKDLKVETLLIGGSSDSKLEKVRSNITSSPAKNVGEETVHPQSRDKMENKTSDFSKDTGKTLLITKEKSKTLVIQDTINVVCTPDIKARSENLQGPTKAVPANLLDGSEKMQGSSRKSDSPVAPTMKVEDTPLNCQGSNESETSVDSESSGGSADKKVTGPPAADLTSLDEASTVKGLAEKTSGESIDVSDSEIKKPSDAAEPRDCKIFAKGRFVDSKSVEGIGEALYYQTEHSELDSVKPCLGFESVEKSLSIVPKEPEDCFMDSKSVEQSDSSKPSYGDASIEEPSSSGSKEPEVGLVDSKSVEGVAFAQSSQPKQSKLDNLTPGLDDASDEESSSIGSDKLEGNSKINVPCTAKPLSDPVHNDVLESEETPRTVEKESFRTCVVPVDNKQAEEKDAPMKAVLPEEVPVGGNVVLPVISLFASIENISESMVKNEQATAAEKIAAEKAENPLEAASSTSGLEITPEVVIVSESIETSAAANAKTESDIPSSTVNKEAESASESVVAKEDDSVEEAINVEPMTVDDEAPSNAAAATKPIQPEFSALEIDTTAPKEAENIALLETIEQKLTEKMTCEDGYNDPAQGETKKQEVSHPTAIEKSLSESATLSEACGGTDSEAEMKLREEVTPAPMVPEMRTSIALSVAAELTHEQDKRVAEEGKGFDNTSNVAVETTLIHAEESKVPSEPTEDTLAANFQPETISSGLAKPCGAGIGFPFEKISTVPPVSEPVKKAQGSAQLRQGTSNFEDSCKSVDQDLESKICHKTPEASVKSTLSSELIVVRNNGKLSDIPSPAPTLSEEKKAVAATSKLSVSETQLEPMETSTAIPVVKEEIKMEDLSSLEFKEKPDVMDNIHKQSADAGCPATVDVFEKTSQTKLVIKQSSDVLITSDEAGEKIQRNTKTETSIQVKREAVVSDVDIAKPDMVPEIKSPQKPKFSKFKSTYELMKSMDFGKPKELYNEPDALTIVNYEKLAFFSSRLKQIQEGSDIALLTSKIVFVPYDFTDQFVMKSGLLCKHKDRQKNDVFIVLLKSTAVYREIVSALTEQYPDLEFNEFMSLIDSSFTYITPAEIKSFADAIDQKLVSMNYHNFIERCNIVNFHIIESMLEQLKTMQKADSTILHRYNRLKANGDLDDSYILKYDLVCQFVGTVDFKVWLPKSQPDQIAIMYVVHETNHDQNLVTFLELLRATFEGVNALLIDKPIALCSVCHPPATANATSIVKACEQKCPALKLLPPEVIYKIRQVQMASSVFKAQIDLLTKGQSRPGSRYILDSSLLCKAMTNKEVYRVVISPTGLKEVVTLLHTTYHRKSLDEFVTFVNEFLAVTEEVCSAAFQECNICMKSKSTKRSSDLQNPQPKVHIDTSKKPLGTPMNTAKPLENKRSVSSEAETKDPRKKEMKENIKDSRKVTSGSDAKRKDEEITKKESKERPAKKELAKGQSKPASKQQDSANTPKGSKDSEPPKTTYDVNENTAQPQKTARGKKIRKDIVRDLRANEKIWGPELGDRIKYILQRVPDRVLSDIATSQRSCPELMRTIKALDKSRPVKDAEEMLCGGVLFVLKSKNKPKIAVKPINHINYSLITKIHAEVHDWNVNKVHGTIGNVFDVSPSKAEVEETINWFCHKCMKPETKKAGKIYGSLDEQLEDFYKKIQLENKGKATRKSEETPDKIQENRTERKDEQKLYKEIIKGLPELEAILGRELGDKIKAVSQHIPDTVFEAVIAAQRECCELTELIKTLELSPPAKDTRHVLCGGLLFIVRSKKKAMLVKIHVKPIKNINYLLITKLHATCHDWTVNKLQTVIGISFDVSPTREEVAVTIEWFCMHCQKPDTSSRRKETSASLEDQLKDLYDTIDPSLLKPKDDDDDQDTTVDFMQEVPYTDVRDALAKLPNSVVSKIQLAQMQSNVLKTQIQLLENTDGPAREKGYCLVMSILCKLVELGGMLAWRVMIPSDILKELVVELHTVHYHDMIQEDFSEFVNMFMTVPEDMITELFSSCALCLTTVRRAPTLCERGVNEDLLRKSLANIAEMMEFIINWQIECPAIAKVREGVERCRKEIIAEYLLYKDVLFRLWGKSKGGKGPRPRIAVSLLPNALDEVIKSTHAFYHSNNPNQLINLINTTFDLTVPRNLLVTKIPELCDICRKKMEAQQGGGSVGEEGSSSAVESQNVNKEEPEAADVSVHSAVEAKTLAKEKPEQPEGASSRPLVKEELDLPVDVKTEEEPTPLGVLLLGRLCDQVIEESSNSSRALDSPVPDMPSTSEEKSISIITQSCTILIKRCKYDPELVQEIAEGTTTKRKKEIPKAPAKRGKKTKNLPNVSEKPEPTDENDSGSELALPKRKFVVYSSESETDDSTSKKRKTTLTGSSQKPKRTKK